MAKKPIFDKKNVIVTGGAGFIGSHLCDELIKTSKVICVDNFISGFERNIDHLLKHPDFVFLRHDMNKVLDLDAHPEVKKLQVEFQGIQEIYNLAVPTSPKNFDRVKVETLKANSLAVLNSLDLAVKYQAKHMHASSAVVYGPRPEDNAHVSEDYSGVVDPVSPRANYDEGKRFAESCVATYRDSHKIDAKIARIFRTYGPRMAIREGHMIPDFMLSALDGKDLEIFGDESFSSSMVYVDDMVDGLVKLMASDVTDPVNLGSEREVRISEIAEMIIKMTDSSSKVAYEDPLLFMTPQPLPDIRAAKERLAWLPAITLKSGLKKTLDYAMAHKALLSHE